MNSKSNSTLAIPFITYNEGSGFNLSQEAQQFLMGLPEQRELGIISIVGKYRTGKSFFVNRVLLDQKKGGFQVGPTINPCTKGLWLWKKTMQSSTNQNMDVILIDTEGFGGMDQNANHDSRIFLFSLLLSSYFIYNSVGSIDQNALNTLNLIINLAKDIQTKKGQSQDAREFPSFLWIVRDFTLRMVDKHQNKINSKEYLQNALEFQKGNSDAIQNKNRIRKLLKHFFQDRDCQVMFRPTEDEKDLQKLDEMDNSKLRPEFVKQVQFIREKVYKKVKPKRINQKVLNGRILVSLCKGYMDTINKGLLPNVESAWFYVCRSEGIKAIQEANHFLDGQIQKLLSNPIKQSQLAVLKKELKAKMLAKFQKRSLGSQEGHPDLVQKLQRHFTQAFDTLLKKNKAMWLQKYEQNVEAVTEKIKERIYSDEYSDFSDFIKDYEKMKQQYDQQTQEGDPVEKWKHFNEVSQQLYRLAGETITSKINKNLNNEKIMLQQKMQIQEQEMQEKKKKLALEKQGLKGKIEELEKQNIKLSAVQQTNQNRINQYKNQNDKLYQKLKTLVNQHDVLLGNYQKLKKESKKYAQTEMEEAKNEISSVRSNLQKERALFEMEKKYMQQEIQRFKDRCTNLQNQNRKLRTSTTKIHADHQQLQGKYGQKVEECQILTQTNAAYSKKIEHLLAENSKKNQQMSDQSEWLLEKSYLENQVAFLKNTLNENKRLHDALLVALQQSLSASEGDNNNQLIQANKSLSSALEKVEARSKILQEKYEKVKDFKKLMKNCLSMQCANCQKLIQTSSFNIHLQQCYGHIISIRQKTIPDSGTNIHITVSQTIIKQSQKKPFTQYIIQVSIGDQKWKISKKYKQFTQLQQMLINKFPSIKYPPSCNFLADINNLVNSKQQKNMMAEERRKSLQQYLRDLSKIDQVRNSEIFKAFLDIGADIEEEKSIKKYKETSSQKDKILLL